MSADFLKNQIGSVLAVAPAPQGKARALNEQRNVVLQRGGEQSRAATRWIFADVPRGTLTDDWGNRYDHQVHSLLAGSLKEGEAFVRGLEELGFSVATAEDFFVPLKTLDARDVESSDQLRHKHPRAFALARREHPTPQGVVTAIRDLSILGA